MAGVLAMVLYLGASGRGWLTFLTDDPWWWLVLVPCLVVAAVRAIRARHR